MTTTIKINNELMARLEVESCKTGLNNFFFKLIQYLNAI